MRKSNDQLNVLYEIEKKDNTILTWNTFATKLKEFNKLFAKIDMDNILSQGVCFGEFKGINLSDRFDCYWKVNEHVFTAAIINNRVGLYGSISLTNGLKPNYFYHDHFLI